MACFLNSGRRKPCKDSVGGTRKIYFANYGTIGDITYDVDGESILSINENSPNANMVLYVYDIKGNADLVQNITTSKANGTTIFEQVLSVTFTKLTKGDNEELKSMVHASPYAFVEDFRGNVVLVGLENGLDVTEGNSSTGRDMEDLNGYTMTLTSKETCFANFFTDFNTWLNSGIPSIGGNRNSGAFKDRVLLDGGIVESLECIVQE